MTSPPTTAELDFMSEMLQRVRAVEVRLNELDHEIGQLGGLVKQLALAWVEMHELQGLPPPSRAEPAVAECVNLVDWMAAKGSTN